MAQEEKKTPILDIIELKPWKEPILERFDLGTRVPSGVFFISVFVIGVLTLFSSAYFKGCESISRTNTITTDTIKVGDVVLVEGECALVKSTDGNVSQIKLLRKVPPVIGSEYNPLEFFSYVTEDVINLYKFAYTGTSIIEVSNSLIQPLASTENARYSRVFYVKFAFWIALLSALVSIVFIIFSSRISKKRSSFYITHKLRTKYVADISRNKTLLDSIEFEWSKQKERFDKEFEVKEWREAIIVSDILIDKLTDNVRAFKGEGNIEKLSSIDERQLPNVKRLLWASEIAEKLKSEERYVLTRKDALRCRDIYQDIFKFFGLR